MSWTHAMADARTAHPVIVVLSSPNERPWPGLEVLEPAASVRHASSVGEVAEAIGDADVLLVTDFRTTAVEAAWPCARKLQWVHAMSAGVDALLFPELVESDVPLTNARGVFDRPIAEYVLGLMLCYCKDFAGTMRLQREHQWVHRDTERVDGKRALVVGAGSIGREIARLLRAAGVQVTGMSRRARNTDPDFGRVYQQADLHRLLPEADFVIVAAPLTEDTRGMFGAEEFRLMRPTARLINIARGPIVRTEALVAALRGGDIAGAALDVFEEEPLPQHHPLWDMPQVVVSHHMAGDFRGWREALSRQFIANFERWQRGEPLHNIVDKHRGYAAAQRE